MVTNRPLPGGRRERMKADTARNIRETAARLFRTEGYNSVTMRALADAAGVSTGAIFAHVRNKEELWRFAMGSAPPDYDLAETIALIGSSLPDYRWTLAALDGGFGAEVASAGEEGHAALGATPSAALKAAFDLALAAEARQGRLSAAAV